MRNTFLIARHAYVMYVTRRGFIISLLLFPFWIAVAGIMPQLAARTVPVPAFMVIDHQGGYANAIKTALDRFEAQRTLASLSAFAKSHKADLDGLAASAPDVAAMLRAPEREASLNAYLAAGGLAPTLSKLTPFLRMGGRAFTPPKPLFAVAPASDELLNANDFAAKAALYFNGDRGVGRGLKLTSILVVPNGFDDGAPAQYWSDPSPNIAVSTFLRSTLTQELRARKVSRLAADSVQIAQALKASADVELRDPNAGRKEETSRAVQQFAPFGVAFLLFLATFINSNALLMGVIEEKSTRMIEILLSSASPQEIMFGKLIGAIGASLTTILLWALGLYAVASALAPNLAHEALGAIGALLSTTNGPLILLYFVCGLLIYGALFLGIGSMAASVSDAQALLGPAMLIIVFPNILLSLIIANPNGLFAKLISWIPIYTPYFMLMRLSSHPAPIEIWATAGLTLLTAIFVLLQMTKVFANNVLTTERPPALGKLLRKLFGGSRSGVTARKA